MSKPKPCPFCKGTDCDVENGIVEKNGKKRHVVYVTCYDCGAYNGTNHTTKAEAIENWNSLPGRKEMK